ncbi:MAG: LysE family transporter [Polaromonas sp.]|uniref:LysE family translocator n=1 Tax=Polaromonas sp. TaxID=1869339 RepID=UPI00271CDB9E|nr:LysE family transporter [Polaromonas sp.]MDO9112811.1 LysE family transporter [Polaromonas sp.]MDP1886777.1 LysE family transporter [Polaromonas sp.]
MFTTLLTIALLHWLVLVTPGANVLLVSQLAAGGQRRSAFFAGLGVTTVAVTWALLALLGINVVFAAMPQLRLALQVAGGMYLCYVAVRLWRSGSAGKGEPAALLAAAAAFRLGFLTNIMNPKSALFFGSVFASALPPNPSVSLLAWTVGLVFANALAWHSFLAVAFSHPRVQAAYARQRRGLNRVAGAIVGALGLRLLTTAAAEIKAR